MHKTEGEVPVEACTGFWLLTDQFDFHNVGFSRPVGGDVRFLTCADCEVGPIGYAPAEPGRFYVAHSRVKYLAS